MMQSAEQRWADQALYDLDTARAMQKSGRYRYVLFCCQQALEKALKSLIVKRTSELAPRVHNLLRLAEVAALSLDDEQRTFYGDLSNYYIQMRYPEEIEAFGIRITERASRQVLDEVEKQMLWLRSMLE